MFIGQAPKAIEIKAKINKWDLIKLTSFCTAKETTNKMKRQPRDRQKIFANDVTNNSFFSKIQKQLKELNNNQANQKIEDLNIHLSKGDIQMTNKYMERCSAFLITREMQIKTTRYHLTPVRMVIIKKYTNHKCWRTCEEKFLHFR